MLADVLNKHFHDKRETRILRAGDVLFSVGKKVVHLYVVEQGQVRMQKPLPDAEPLIYQIAGPGDAIAEASLFSSHYECEVIADTDARIWAYSKQRVEQAVDRNPVVAHLVMSSLARHVIDLRGRIELCRIDAPKDRVWRYLQLKADEKGVIAFKREIRDGAHEIALLDDCFEDAVRDLARDGRIQYDARTITLT